jgi:hypothetical protein
MHRPLWLWIWLALLGGYAALPTTALAQRDYEIDQLIFRDDFDGDLREWVIEKRPRTHVEIVDGVVDIRHGIQTRIWYRNPLQRRVMIEYRARALEGEGRPTDLNALWMARDRESTPPLSMDSFFGTEGPLRSDRLATYYTGFGSNRNTTFNFRRFYDPSNMPSQVQQLPRHNGRVILQHHNDDGMFRNPQGTFITPGQWYKFQLVYFDGLVEVYLDDRQAFRYREQPYDLPAYDRGYFAFVTTLNSWTQFDAVRIYSLRYPRATDGGSVPVPRDTIAEPSPREDGGN